jgi:hypothetical protein
MSFLLLPIAQQLSTGIGLRLNFTVHLQLIFLIKNVVVFLSPPVVSFLAGAFLCAFCLLFGGGVGVSVLVEIED